MICISVLIIQIVCFLIFCFCGVKSIEDKLEDLFISGKVRLRRLGFKVSIFNNLLKVNNGEGGLVPGKKFVLWGQIKKLRERRLLREKKETYAEYRQAKD